MGNGVKIILNGHEARIEEGWFIADLIESLGLKPDRLAVEVNRQIVRRAKWSEIRVAAGDRVEIVHFVGGGD